MAIGHDKRDLLQIVPRDRTKLRNKNYNATLNPRYGHMHIVVCSTRLLRTKHGSKGFGGVSACVAFTLVRLVSFLWKENLRIYDRYDCIINN